MSVLILDLGPLRASYPRLDEGTDIPRKAAKRLRHGLWRPRGGHEWVGPEGVLALYPAMGLGVLEGDGAGSETVLRILSASWEVSQAPIRADDDWRDTVAVRLAERTLRRYAAWAAHAYDGGLADRARMERDRCHRAAIAFPSEAVRPLLDRIDAECARLCDCSDTARRRSLGLMLLGGFSGFALPFATYLLGAATTGGGPGTVAVGVILLAVSAGVGAVVGALPLSGSR